MAGAGYKLFNTGDVLLASEVNTYLMQQTVMVFANASARTTALSGVLAEGMLSYLADTNATEVYDGSSWVSVSGTGDITAVTAGTGLTGGGTTGAVTLTNDMATTITASGDIVVGTGNGTYDNLPIGTTGQVLTADTTVSPYKVKWATPAAGSFTKISATTFSSVATQNIDSVFTSSYNTYLVAISAFSAATSTDDVRMRLRYSTSTESGGSYYGCRTNMPYSGTLATTGYNGTTYMELAVNSGAAGQGSSGWFYVNMVGGSSTNVAISGQFWEGNAAAGNVFLFDVGGAARTYTGFQLFSSSSNISGTVVVYGLEE